VRALCTLRAQHHDVSVLHVLDPHERTFPYEGLTEFHGLESAAKLLANPATIRKEYLARMDTFCAKCHGTLAQAGVDYHEVLTDRPLERTLLDLLITRARLLPGQTRRTG
jgi:uncharacterized protein (DUF58 family)